MASRLLALLLMCLLSASAFSAVSLVQGTYGNFGTADVINYGVAPTEGNLLVMVSIARSPTSTPFTPGGAGWTVREEQEFDVADGTYRRQIALASKIAGASEGTSHGGTWNADPTETLILLEFSGVTDGTFLDADSNSNGTTANATSLSIGTTASSSGTVLLVGVMAAKKNSANPSGSVSVSFASEGLTTVHSEEDGSNDIAYGVGWAEVSGTGAKSSTGTLSATTTTNNGLYGVIAAFQVEAGSSTTIPVLHHQLRNQ